MSNVQLRDTAVAALKATTITYQDWLKKNYPALTQSPKSDPYTFEILAS